MNEEKMESTTEPGQEMSHKRFSEILNWDDLTAFCIEPNLVKLMRDRNTAEGHRLFDSLLTHWNQRGAVMRELANEVMRLREWNKQKAQGEIKMQTVNDIPRRIRMDCWTPAERAIAAAMQAVEESGCHPLLTDAVELLAQARNKVADFVELPDTTPAQETGG
jgi:hypothetical protein